MKKTLLMGLFLILVSTTSYAQLTETVIVTPSDVGVNYIEINDSVQYDEQDILKLLNFGISDLDLYIKIECIGAPVGVVKSDYTQQTVITESKLTDILHALLNSSSVDGLLGLNNKVFSDAEGDYEFTLSRFKLDNLGGQVGLMELKNFTINVGPEGTLGLKNVENSSEFSLFSKDGIVTIKNANESNVTGMTIYSISGRQVYASNKAESSIDLRAVANGVYVLSVKEGASILTKKFIKD